MSHMCLIIYITFGSGSPFSFTHICKVSQSLAIITLNALLIYWFLKKIKVNNIFWSHLVETHLSWIFHFPFILNHRVSWMLKPTRSFIILNTLYSCGFKEHCNFSSLIAYKPFEVIKFRGENVHHFVHHFVHDSL